MEGTRESVQEGDSTATKAVGDVDYVPVLGTMMVRVAVSMTVRGVSNVCSTSSYTMRGMEMVTGTGFSVLKVPKLYVSHS